MNSTDTTITDQQIKQLRDEAGAAGDAEQVIICNNALAGVAFAREECERVILEARAETGNT